VTTVDPAATSTAHAPLASLQPASVAYRKAFVALLARDLHVLLKSWVLFAIRALVQPVMLMFIFTYVFPKIGQSVGGAGGAAHFTTILVAGVLGLAIIFQGIQAVALPLVQEFGYSKEIEDRVLAPLPTKVVGVQKIVTGMVQGLIAAALVFPIAYIVPATKVHLHINWLILLTMAPLAGWVSAALGLVLGTRVAPQNVSYLFALVVLPITFLGAIYYPWGTLGPIKWLKFGVLINPLVYMTEGFRAALLRPNPHHMNIGAVYGALVLFAIALTWIGVNGFQKRVVT
jgi:ABC-2 type transport system permease protein